jgi:hypothetical protein
MHLSLSDSYYRKSPSTKVLIIFATTVPQSFDRFGAGHLFQIFRQKLGRKLALESKLWGFTCTGGVPG